MNIKKIILLERSIYSTNYHVLSISQTSRNCDFWGQVGEVYFLLFLKYMYFIYIYIYICMCIYVCVYIYIYIYFPGGSAVKNPPVNQCRWCKFNPWVRKIPWWRAWQPTPVFLQGESPWTDEPDKLESMWLQRVKHNWATSTAYMYLHSVCY